jgi:hypothetical protein
MSTDEEKRGTPFKPLKVKCLSIGRPSKTEAYLSIVAADGRQFCFETPYAAARLIRVQAGEFVDAYPVEPKK